MTNVDNTKSFKENLLDTANILYQQERYWDALDSYIQFARQFGIDAVHTRIAECINCVNISGEIQPRHLDSVTTIMLHNAGTLYADTHTIERARSDCLTLVRSGSHPLSTRKLETGNTFSPENSPRSTNDFYWYEAYFDKSRNTNTSTHNVIGISVVIPTYNRPNILGITLACLAHQKTMHPFEVIVADDGSSVDILETVRHFENVLDIKYVRQPDDGYRLCAVRNLGIRTAKHPFVGILDCDMAPCRTWVEDTVTALSQCDDIALIGPRKYVDTSLVSANDVLENPDLVEKLPEIYSNRQEENSVSNGVSLDWRIDYFEKSENLRFSNNPFLFFSGGNVAFKKQWIDKVGGFDEEFTQWGREDNEFGYRLYREGCFFKAFWGALAYHQEPPGKENETDRIAGAEITAKLFLQKVPYYGRSTLPLEKSVVYTIPLVSLVIDVDIFDDGLRRSIDSILNQTFSDLEIVIRDDDSTIFTRAALTSYYGSNPRIRRINVNKKRTALPTSLSSICRGFYIAQIARGRILHPRAVALCIDMLKKNKSIALIHASEALHHLILERDMPSISRSEDVEFNTTRGKISFNVFPLRAWNIAARIATVYNANITSTVPDIVGLREVGECLFVNENEFFE
ncbi:MAG: glycosyltransferase [Deltaproteobacteria bacterium]|nr:glycosyltransferase [Deltaproteobacteria bacterium]